MSDTILLTIPASTAYRGVPSLVLGGVGSRLDLPFERMDDLQLAVLSMLDASVGEETSVEIVADDGRLGVSVGPLRPDAGSDKGLDLVLRRLTDDVQAEHRSGNVWLKVSLERSAAERDGAPAD